LWPLEGFNVWWSLKWEGEASFSPFFTFPSNNCIWTFFFPLDLKVLLYNGSRLSPYTFVSFSLIYKLQPCILMYQVFHTFIVKLILIKDLFFLSLNSWHHDFNNKPLLLSTMMQGLLPSRRGVNGQLWNHLTMVRRAWSF
jgi:hypothetical protein